MTISFKTTDATVRRGRAPKPIPPDAMAAIDAALSSGKNVEAVVTDEQANELRTGLNRLRRQDETYSFGMSFHPDKPGKQHFLLFDVKRV